MKRLILFLCAASASIGYAYFVKVDGGGRVSANKYIYNGQPVWSDGDRSEMIAGSVDTGTGSITTGNFILETVPSLDQNVIDDLTADGTIQTAGGALSEIDLRTARKYNFAQMIFYRNAIQTYVQGSSGTSIDVSNSTQAFAAKFIQFRNRYNAATH